MRPLLDGVEDKKDMNKIYLSPPDVGPREREMLLDAFDSGWIAPLGPHVDAFENEMAEYLGVKGAAALSSGTAALHLALIMAGVGAGDRVITCTLTFAATVNAIRYVNAEPVFIDCDDRWVMDADLLEAQLKEDEQKGRLPKAVMPVDLYGQACDYTRLEAICKKYKVILIEDAAEGLGAIHRGRKAGSFGMGAALSFNGNKTITTSGGGMFVSNDEALVQEARFLSTQARDQAPHYQHSRIGYNYRLSNLLAALGRAQLETLEDKVARRRAHNRFYSEAFRGIAGLEMMKEAKDSRCTFWLSCFTLNEDAKCSREDVRLHLESLQIEARPVWKPMHLQPVFEKCERRLNGNSERLFDIGLCIPSGSVLSDQDRSRVVEGILEKVA